MKNPLKLTKKERDEMRKRELNYERGEKKMIILAIVTVILGLVIILGMVALAKEALRWVK